MRRFPKPIGIRITVDGRRKFIGKCGSFPPDGGIPILSGYPVFYRAAPYADAYSYETDSIGVDVAAAVYAVHLGALYMVNWLAPDGENPLDVGDVYVAGMDKITRAAVVDLGERKQFRLRITDWRSFGRMNPIVFPYTKIVHDADVWYWHNRPTTKPTTAAHERVEDPRQPRLFNFGENDNE